MGIGMRPALGWAIDAPTRASNVRFDPLRSQGHPRVVPGERPPVTATGAVDAPFPLHRDVFITFRRTPGDPARNDTHRNGSGVSAPDPGRDRTRHLAEGSTGRDPGEPRAAHPATLRDGRL